MQIVVVVILIDKFDSHGIFTKCIASIAPLKIPVSNFVMFSHAILYVPGRSSQYRICLLSAPQNNVRDQWSRSLNIVERQALSYVVLWYHLTVAAPSDFMRIDGQTE